MSAGNPIVSAAHDGAMPAYEPTQAPSLGPNDRPTDTCSTGRDRREEDDFASDRPVFSPKNRDDKIITDFDLCIPLPRLRRVVRPGMAERGQVVRSASNSFRRTPLLFGTWR